MAVTTGETDIVGGGGGYGFGGFGGIAPIGLIGLNTLFGRGFGNELGRGDGIAGTTVLEQNVSELRKDVQGVNTTVESLGNELQGAIFNLNNGIQANFRSLDNQICGIDKTVMQTAYQQSLQAFQNTQSIQNQMTAFQVANDKEFCAIKSQINADGDATRSLITQNLIDGLRAELNGERRNRDNREIEINVSQNAVQTQNQLQAQMQSQNQFIASMFNALGDQVNRATNSVVNVGSGLVAGSQSNSNANTKVNS